MPGAVEGDSRTGRKQTYVLAFVGPRGQWTWREAIKGICANEANAGKSRAGLGECPGDIRRQRSQAGESRQELCRGRTSTASAYRQPQGTGAACLWKVRCSKGREQEEVGEVPGGTSVGSYVSPGFRVETLHSWFMFAQDVLVWILVCYCASWTVTSLLRTLALSSLKY